MTPTSQRIPVAVAEIGSASYPNEPPFDPPEKFPELPVDIWHLDPSNRVYSGVREAFHLLGLDAEHYGRTEWNPLGGIVRPGDRVVIKPNVVRDFHGGGLNLEALVTHGSVVRAVLDYVAVALKGAGSITVGDSPLQYADFEKTLKATGLARVIEEARGYAGVPIQAVDFRRTRSEKRGGLIVARLPNPGDPNGYQVVDLRKRSSFTGLNPGRMRRFRVTQYDPSTMGRAHNESSHAYLFPASILRADVLINIPKLKTHRKAGLTAAMKNLVGINGSKDWLPHHTQGAKDDGGDEYLHRSLRKSIIGLLRDRISGRHGRIVRQTLHLMERSVRATGRFVDFPDPYWEGSWHGNDTVWRMVHDLHRVLFYADVTGAIREQVQRRCFVVVDAVVAGEADGPMRPTPRPSGLVVAGGNPVAVDAVCCRLMGFDETKVPLLRHAIGQDIEPTVPDIGAIQVMSNTGRWRQLFDLPRAQTLCFAPPDSWAGAIELPA